MRIGISLAEPRSGSLDELATTLQQARDEGLTIARELVGELAGRVQGVQITVASGAVDAALRVLEAIHA